MSTFTPFAEKMESAGVSAAAVNAFSRCYEALVSNHSGMISETDILPADQVEDWQDITASTPAADKDLISRCVCIKLNGGLGTSMGLQKAKSLLKVKGEDTFLDLIVRQVKHLRSISGTPVRLLLMNSFSTSADTLAYLENTRRTALRTAPKWSCCKIAFPKSWRTASPRPAARNSRSWNGARPAMGTCIRPCWGPAGWTACWRMALNTLLSPIPTIWAPSLT